MTLTDQTKDRIFHEVLYGESLARPDTKEEKEYRKVVIAENSKAFKELDQAEAVQAEMELAIRKKLKSEDWSEEEIEKEMPLSFSKERLKKLRQIYKDWKLSEGE
ncbi:MAG: hypothetical protein HN936_07270 [Bacteroidetes bacterium]|jgi:hypothetical protein|nr:hypothetical protein [Candidatus Neomarinimicrobiota bacterium]MBT7093029.1 hypothetical protein [Bacteroidota bacterium]MBT7580356.1 hypothetical protein [Candidatus Neomarinimicrobiota bacterium]